jgi:hypothetical protein
MTSPISSGVKIARADFSWMVNRTFSEVRFGMPAVWHFCFEPNSRITAECPWRLLRNGRIAISSEDHLQRYGLSGPIDPAAVAAETIGNGSIASVQVRNDTADLLIEFSHGVRLEIIPLSIGYESWSVTAPSGLWVVAQGGGQLCGLRADA